MSAKKLAGANALQPAVSVASRDARLELSADMVSIHKNGIEFRSPSPFKEWSEMTVALQSPQDGSRISCHGVIVACTGGKQAGYNVSMVFTSMTPQAEKRLGTAEQSFVNVLKTYPTQLTAVDDAFKGLDDALTQRRIFAAGLVEIGRPLFRRQRQSGLEYGLLVWRRVGQGRHRLLRVFHGAKHR